MRTEQSIRDAYVNPDEHPLIRQAIEWQFRKGAVAHLVGDWHIALWDLITDADEHNLNLLAVGWPDKVEAVRRYRTDQGFSDAMHRAIGDER